LLKILKTYNFPLKNPSEVVKEITFSARPGDLESKDDFYILDNNLVISETSLWGANKTLFNKINNTSLPTWIRVNVANRMAKSLFDWIQFFSVNNSGTHNNQWMLMDLNELAKPKADVVVIMLEQFFDIID